MEISSPNKRRISAIIKLAGQGMKNLVHSPVLLLSVFIIILAAVFLTRQTTISAADRADDINANRLPVSTSAVHYQDAHTIRHSFTGRISARQMSDISFDMSGIVEAIYVDHGSTVNAGDPLAMLDTKRTEFRLAQAQAERTDLLARQQLAKATRVRIEDVHGRGNASDQNLDEAIANENSINAQLASVEARIATEELNMQRSVLRAPFAGAVDRRFLDEGVVVGVGTPLLRLIAGSEMEAHIGFPRKYADQLSLDQRVILVSEDNKPYRAKVSQVAPAVRGDTRTQLVTFQFEEDVPVKDGELVSITIEINEEGRGFWVPLRALTADIRGLWRLYVIRQVDGDSAVDFENVQVKYVDGARAYVFGSVDDGVLFINEGIDRITPGQRVIVVQRSATQ